MSDLQSDSCKEATWVDDAPGIGQSNGDSKRVKTAPNALWITLLFEAFLGGLAVAGAALFQFKPLQPFSWNWLDAAIGMFSALPLYLAACILLPKLSYGWVDSLKAIQSRLVVLLFRGGRWWKALLVSVAAGVCEELAFRGLLQACYIGILLKLSGSHTWSTLFAVLFVSLLFGFMHCATFAYFVITTSMGAYFSLLQLGTANLLTPIIAHVLYDYLVLMTPTAVEKANENKWEQVVSACIRCYRLLKC